MDKSPERIQLEADYRAEARIRHQQDPSFSPLEGEALEAVSDVDLQQRINEIRNANSAHAQVQQASSAAPTPAPTPEPRRRRLAFPAHGHNGEPPAHPPADDRDHPHDDRRRGPDWGLLGTVAGIVVIGLVALLAILAIREADPDYGDLAVWNWFDGDEDIPASIGGDDKYWRQEGVSWVYQGPLDTFDVPQGYRLDYPGNSCAIAGSKGAYGGSTVYTNIATLWWVGNETSCPTQAATNPTGSNPSGDQTGSTTTTIGQPNSGSQPAVFNGRMNTTPQDTSRCNDDDWAESVLGIDVQGLGEEDCGWVIAPRHVGPTTATCPTGWVCTLTLTDERVVVVIGDGSSYNVTAGTFRYVIGYMLGDKIREEPPCAHLASEQEFGANRKPSFPVYAGNFSCDGSGAINTSTTTTTVATSPSTGGSTAQCGEPATDLGGGVWVASGTKYSLQGSATITGHPAWTVHTNAHPGDPGLPPGQSETTNGASAYCDPYKG